MKSNFQTIELLRSHRSIRKFTKEKVPMDLLLDLISSGQSAASSSFFQAVTIMRVTDSEKRAAFKEITAGQAYVQEAPEFLVFCADSAFSMLHRAWRHLV